MRTLLNLIWVVFGGFWLWLGYLFFGVIACLLIVTIPAGVASFRIAGYALWPFGRTVVTIGVFDGVHRGHRAVLAETVRQARQGDLTSVALTFDPHPVLVHRAAPIRLVTTLADRIDRLAAAGIDAVDIAPPFSSPRTLDAVAGCSRGYVYAVSRVGVTGTEQASSTVGLADSVTRLRADAAAPVMLGFGISRPEQVAEAIAAGADGAISGSATVKIVEAHAPALLAARPGSPEHDAELEALTGELRDFVTAMKAATARPDDR